MRGEDVRDRIVLRCPRGITPACAGKTFAALSARFSASDHPRMRGEDGSRPDSSPIPRGSPPHARGRLWRRPRAAECVRITPACAGKTRRTALSISDFQDHPRMRGEDSGHRRGRLPSLGSPPHARGRPDAPDGILLTWRITPACAGKTPLSRPPNGEPRDHPRMRGEDPSVLVP